MQEEEAGEACLTYSVLDCRKVIIERDHLTLDAAGTFMHYYNALGCLQRLQAFGRQLTTKQQENEPPTSGSDSVESKAAKI